VKSLFWCFVFFSSSLLLEFFNSSILLLFLNSWILLFFFTLFNSYHSY
jgi:hypothetical protein